MSDPRTKSKKQAAEVGTDTAEIYAIAPEALYDLVNEGDWHDLADSSWGDSPKDSEVESKSPFKDMGKLIREHGGAVFQTGGDGSFDVKVKDSVSEAGLKAPYGTADYGKTAADTQQLAELTTLLTEFGEDLSRASRSLRVWGATKVPEEERPEIIGRLQQRGQRLYDLLDIQFENPAAARGWKKYLRRAKNFRKIVKVLKDAPDWEALTEAILDLNSKTKSAWEKFYEYANELKAFVRTLDIEVEETFDVGGFHVVMYRMGLGDWTSENVGRMKWVLEESSKLVAKRGLGTLARGTVYAYPTAKVPGSHGTLASYRPSSDTLTLAAGSNLWMKKTPKDILNTVVHELGHRAYFQLMGGAGRAAWTEFFEMSKDVPDVAGMVAGWKQFAANFSREMDSRKARHFRHYYGHLAKKDPVEAAWLLIVVDSLGIRAEEKYDRYHGNPTRTSKAALDELERRASEVKVFMHPVTTYSATSAEELFAEVFSHYIVYGPRTIAPIVRPQLLKALPAMKMGSVEDEWAKLAGASHEMAVVVGHMKAAGWWAINPETGKGMKPPVDKGGLMNAVPGADPDDKHYLGDGPLDARIDFVEKIDEMYRRSWDRPVTLPELAAIFKVPEHWSDDDANGWNEWVDVAALHMGVPMSAVLSLPEDSLREARSMWRAYRNSGVQIGVPITSETGFPEPTEEARQEFLSHIEASFSLHYADAKKFVGQVPEDKMPSWAKKAGEAHDKTIALMKWLSRQTKSLGVSEHTYTVGGAVRNYLIDEPIKDIDMVIDSVALGRGRDAQWLAEKLVRVIPTRTEIAESTLKVSTIFIKGSWVLDGFDMEGEAIDIATARSEEYERDEAGGYVGHKPIRVEPVTIEEDIHRREFTFNTLLWRMHDLADGPDKAEILDLSGCGRADLENREMRCPSDPDKTFKEDPTRMIRTIKFAFKYGFKVPPDTLAAIKRNADEIKRVPSKVWQVLHDIVLESPHYKKALLVMEKLGLIEPLRDMVQDNQQFQSTILGYTKGRGIAFMFDLMDLGLPVGTHIKFLDGPDQTRLREITVGMDRDEAWNFMLAVKKPGIAFDDKKFQPGLAREYGIKGREMAGFMQAITAIGREALLADPDLADNSAKLKSLVAQKLRSKMPRTASGRDENIETDWSKLAGGDGCNPRTHSHSWIDPKGKVHVLHGEHIHDSWAREQVLERMSGIEAKYHGKVPTWGAMLMEEGWIRVANFTNLGMVKPPRAALAALVDLMIECAHADRRIDPETEQVFVDYRSRGGNYTLAEAVGMWGGRQAEDRLFEGLMSKVAHRFPEYRGKSKAWLRKEHARLEEERAGVGYGPKPVNWVPRSVSNPEIIERQVAIKTEMGQQLWQRLPAEAKSVAGIPERKHKQLVERARRDGEDVPVEVLEAHGLRRASVPTPVEDEWNKLAGKMPLNSDTVAQFRKDFLTLMKNTGRINRDEKRLATWRKAMAKWHGRFEEFGAQIRKDLEGRIRVNKGKPGHEQTVNIPWAQRYLDKNRAFWDFAYELRSVPDLDYKAPEPMEDLRKRLIEAPYYRGRPQAEVEREIDEYLENALYRGHIKTPEAVKEQAWDKWAEETRKWAARTKSKARAAWKWLIELAEWTERGGMYGGGEEAIELVEPTVENITLEGFQMHFIGFPEAGEFWHKYLPTFKAGLKQFRARAGKVFPWMLQHMLPLEIMWAGVSDSGRFAATYERNHITVSIWGATADPKGIAHILAHEMGHHVFQTLLSGAQQKDWTTFIKGDYIDLDLREVLTRMRPGESTSAFSKRIEDEDPILHIQIETTLHHHATSHWDLLNVASIQDHLDAGRQAIIQVPANPITGYANKNPEEAFCEALGKLVAWGPRTLPDPVNWWLKQMLPNLKMATKVAAVPERYKHINFTPPESVANAAKRGLELRQKASPSNRGGLTTEEAAKEGIGSGVQRAVNLKNRNTISPEVIKQMRGFLSRSEKSSKISPENRDTPWNDKGYVAWLLWGGDPAVAWTDKIIKQMDTADEKQKQQKKQADSDGSYMTTQHLRSLADHAQELLYNINDYTPMQDWAESQVTWAATALTGVYEYMFHGKGRHLASKGGSYMTTQRLREIEAHASALLTRIDDHTQLPDWAESKISQAAYWLLNVYESVRHQPRTASENQPTNPELWGKVQKLTKGEIKSLSHKGKTIEGPNDGQGFDIFPSAYANGWASKVYKELGGGWKKEAGVYIVSPSMPSSVRVARGKAKKDVGHGGLDEWFSGHGGAKGKGEEARWGDWVAISPVSKTLDSGKKVKPGDIVGPCGISDDPDWKEVTNNGKDPLKCMPRDKAHDMPKKERAEKAKAKQRAEKKDQGKGKKPTMTPTFKEAEEYVVSDAEWLRLAGTHRAWTQGEIEALPDGSVLERKGGDYFIRSRDQIGGWIYGDPDSPSAGGKAVPLGLFRLLPDRQMPEVMVSIADVQRHRVDVSVPSGNTAEAEKIGKYIQTSEGTRSLKARMRRMGVADEPNLSKWSLSPRKSRIQIPVDTEDDGFRFGSKHKDEIPGGVGDQTKPEDVDPKQLAKGVKVEMEHTDDPAKAREIALDHLSEPGNADYYDRLETIEKHAVESEWLRLAGRNPCNPNAMSTVWIDPHGKRHDIPSGDTHSSWATKFLGGDDVVAEMDVTGIDKLLSDGWVRVSNLAAIEMWTERTPSRQAFRALADLIVGCTLGDRRFDPEQDEIIVEYTKGGGDLYTIGEAVSLWGGRQVEDEMFGALMERRAGVFKGPPVLTKMVQEWVVSVWAAHVLAMVEIKLKAERQTLTDQQLGELVRLQRAAQRHASRPKLRKGQVKTRFDITVETLRGWPYVSHDDLDNFDVDEGTEIEVVLSFKSSPTAGMWEDMDGSSNRFGRLTINGWAPSVSLSQEWTVKEYVEQTMDMLDTVRHEVEHAGQEIMQEALLIDEAGRSGESRMRGEWMRGDMEKGTDSDLEGYEFYPRLRDEVAKFVRTLRNHPKDKWRDHLRDWVKTEGILGKLHRFDKERWRKAVGEFFVEVDKQVDIPGSSRLRLSMTSRVRLASVPLLPIMEPLFNMREIAKQMILLEDHLFQSRKRCMDCVRKHLLTIEALAEEAVTLVTEDTDPKWAVVAEALAEVSRMTQVNIARGEDLTEIAQAMRRTRKGLVEKLYEKGSPVIDMLDTTDEEAATLLADITERGQKTASSPLRTLPDYGASDDEGWERLAAGKFKDKKEVPKADGSGKTTVYEYSDRQVTRRNNEKAERVEKLRKNMGKLRAQVNKDLAKKDPQVRLTALAVALIDQTYERVGNDESAGKGHFGVTGWRVEHVSFKGSKATFKYVGKSGVKQEKTVDDPKVVSALKSCCKDKPKDETLLCEGDECRISASDVNAYLKPFDVTAKDLRGLHANEEMRARLTKVRSKGGALPKEHKKKKEKLKAEFQQALEGTAGAVGHEPSTLRSQYLVPGIEDEYTKHGTVPATLNKKGSSWENPAFVASVDRWIDTVHPVFAGADLAPAPVEDDWHRLATKSDEEKQEEKAEDLIKPAPKKKPPRRDLKKRLVDDDDPDLKKDQKDKSMNYKDIGASAQADDEEDHPAQPLRVTPADVRYGPTAATEDDWLRLAARPEEHAPGTAWKDSGKFYGKNKDGEQRTFENIESAEAFAAGQDPEEAEEDAGEGGPGEVEPPETGERPPELPKAFTEKYPDLDAAQVGDFVKKLDPSMSDKDLFDALEDAVLDSLPGDADLPEWVDSMDAKDFGKLVDQMTDGAREQHKVDQKVQKEKAKADKELANKAKTDPLLLGKKPISEDVEPGAQLPKARMRERSKEAYEHYDKAKPDVRAKAVASLLDDMHGKQPLSEDEWKAKELAGDTSAKDYATYKKEFDAEEGNKGLDPRSPRYQEAKAILDGIALSAQIKGEDIKGIPKAPGRLNTLQKMMVEQGHLDQVLDTGSDFTSADSRKAISDSMAMMTDDALMTLAKGDPALTKMAKILQRDDVDEDYREMVRDMMRTSMQFQASVLVPSLREGVKGSKRRKARKADEVADAVMGDVDVGGMLDFFDSESASAEEKVGLATQALATQVAKAAEDHMPQKQSIFSAVWDALKKGDLTALSATWETKPAPAKPEKAEVGEKPPKPEPRKAPEIEGSDEEVKERDALTDKLNEDNDALHKKFDADHDALTKRFENDEISEAEYQAEGKRLGDEYEAGGKALDDEYDKAQADLDQKWDYDSYVADAESKGKKPLSKSEWEEQRAAEGESKPEEETEPETPAKKAAWSDLYNLAPWPDL
jgi:hypothetical protein